MHIIFHIDINAFFASVEQIKDPSLKNLPLVVAGKSKRAIVTTASYEARKYGIHSAMPLFQARKLCADLIVRNVDFELYRKISNHFFEIISSYSSIIEVASIDECYVDLTNYIVENKITPLDLAKTIQNTIFQQLKLDVSIGIAPNKFFAKMASDMKKPKGITIITNSNFKETIWPLPIKDMYGVGVKTYPKLITNGIKTIGDVANRKNYDLLRIIVGNYALILHRRANGIDTRKVNCKAHELKSVGNSKTLPYDSDDVEMLYDVFSSLAHQVSARAKKKQLIGNTITITIRYQRNETITRQIIIDDYIHDYETILSTAKSLFDQYYNNQTVRLLGITLNNVVNIHEYKQQLSFFKHQRNYYKKPPMLYLTDEQLNAQDVFEIKLIYLQPSQLYLCKEKIEQLEQVDIENYKPIEVRMINNSVVIIDGHTRAYQMYQHGHKEINAIWDHSKEHNEEYFKCVEWCQKEDIYMIENLKDYIISSNEYEQLWIKRCKEIFK